MADRAELTAELRTLEAKLNAITVQMQQAEARQQYLLRSEPLGGKAKHQALLAEMDRTMTRMRAVEAKLAILDSGGELPLE